MKKYLRSELVLRKQLELACKLLEEKIALCAFFPSYWWKVKDMFSWHNSICVVASELSRGPTNPSRVHFCTLCRHAKNPVS